MAGESHNIFEHSQDTQYWELIGGAHIKLPEIPLPIPAELANAVGLHGATFRMTKFMVMELIAGVLLVAIFVPLARRARAQMVPRGRLWNFFEAILLFIRDQVARPAIGQHDADRFLPYLWTAFMFILFCNLLGLVPFGASATGSLSVTGPLALCTFATVLAAGIQRFGPGGYWKSMVPHMDLHPVMGLVLKPLIFVLELIGTIIRHGVLSVRLFANIFAGHTVLFVILGFITVAGNLIFVVAPASILGVVALSLLELFIAFLQAYIFTFLSALFIGMALHPH